jgi:pimeloyl-ACP methyl ester carboxylesterase
MQEIRSHYDDVFEPMTGTTPGTGLSYLMAGAGAPVVLLHGWGAFKEL